MTVFKTFLKILRKNMAMIIVYTLILVIFGGFSMQSQDKSLSFSAIKPDVLIINKDDEIGITKGFIDYLKENTNTPTVEDSDEARDDALFYNETDYIIYIPDNFNKDFMLGNIDNIEVKKGNNFNAAYTDMLINRYLKIASTYRNSVSTQDELVNKINDTLKNNTEIEITTKLDTTALEQADFFFNFESYSMLVCLIFIISLILSIFNSENIRKRNVISSTSYRKNNRILLLSNLLYAFIIWLIYLVLGIIILGDILWTSNGIIFIINSFIHLLVVTTLAFLIGNLVTNKDAINGVTNVVGIGTSFLCGVFVPISYLPTTVTNIAHLLPTYYYVRSNDIVKELEVVNIDTLRPIFINWAILIAFAILFLVLTNIISNKKRKIG